MIVKRMSDGEDHGHNHDQNHALQIKKKTSDIIKKVLSENEDFSEFYENSSTIPKKNSMARFIQCITIKKSE